MSENLKAAISKWRNVLGKEFVRDDEETLGRYAFCAVPEGQRSVAILKPDTVEQIQAILKIANEFKIPLYPVSRGKNWGYGEMCPVSENNVILDLSRMDRILEVNEKLAYAVVEPGVTQQQLFDYIENKKISLSVDTTGAPPTASLIGNAIERGYGFSNYSDHYMSSCGMEVVLADGTLLKTGFGHFQNSRNQYLHKWGIGPVLDGLFSQSNLGIITKMGIWLAPKPDYYGILSLSLKNDGQFGEAIETVRNLKLKGILTGAFHFFNDIRAISSMRQYPWKESNHTTPLSDALRTKLTKAAGLTEWNGLGILRGSRRQVIASLKEIRKAFRGTGRLRFVPHWILEFAYRWRVIFKTLLGDKFVKKISFVGIARGVPTWEPCDALFWRKKKAPPKDPENFLGENCGLIWLSPVVPITREAVFDFIRAVKPLCHKYGFEFNVSINVFGERVVDCVLGILYDKDSAEEVSRAKECHDALLNYCLAAGFIPYRAGGPSMRAIADPNDIFWQVARKIKKALDPHHIIAPGRYLPARDSNV